MEIEIFVILFLLRFLCNQTGCDCLKVLMWIMRECVGFMQIELPN